MSADIPEQPAISRERATLVNFSGGALAYVVVVILSFCTRTVFVVQLGDDHLGLNAIFLNLIALVSVAEAGVATAGAFRLYAPLARRSTAQVVAWLSVVRFYYRLALLAMLLLGALATALLPSLTRETGFATGYVVSVFWLAMGQVVATCVFATEKILLLADQRNYVVVAVQSGVLLAQSALQVTALLVWHSFAWFLLVQVVGTLSWNLGCHVYARRHYPGAYFDAPPVGARRRDLGTDVWHLFPYKVGAVGLNATDAILISLLFKATLAGLVSNYVLIVNSVNGVLMQAFNGAAAAIGTHSLEADEERRTAVFYQLTMLSIWVFGTASVCLAVLLNPFIELWLGSRFLLSGPEVLGLVGAFYVTGVNQVPSLYRSSLGIFRQTKFVPLVATVLNIGLSVALAHALGLVGIFLATILARGLTFSVIDPILVSRHSLVTGPGVFLMRMVRATVGVFMMFAGLHVLAIRVDASGTFEFIGLGLAVAALAGAGLAGWLSLDHDFRAMAGRICPRPFAGSR